jgi:hypothetical protein
MKRKQFTYVQTQVCKNANTTKDWIFSESKFRKSMSSTCLYKHILAKYESLCKLDADSSYPLFSKARILSLVKQIGRCVRVCVCVCVCVCATNTDEEATSFL